MADLEKLITQGVASYGLKVRKIRPVAFFPNPDGYGYSVVYGDIRGVKEWAIVFKNLVGDVSQFPITLADGTVQNTFEYIRDFMDRHFEPEVRPFIVRCPADGKDYTAMFTDPNFELSFDNFRLWSTGIVIRQWRSGEALLEGMQVDNVVSI